MSDQRTSGLLTFPLLTSVVLVAVGCFVCSAAEGLQLTLVSRDLVGERLREGNVRGKERQALVERLFKEAGCDTTLQAIDKRSANVICDLPGETNSTLIVGAHFDFADEGQGIVDDWSGVSMLASLYQALKSNVPKHSYEFVAFAGEERGLLGSRRYVKELGARSNFVPQAFINLECLGLTTPTCPSLDSRGGKRWLKRDYVPVRDRPRRLGYRLTETPGLYNKNGTNRFVVRAYSSYSG